MALGMAMRVCYWMVGLPLVWSRLKYKYMMEIPMTLVIWCHQHVRVYSYPVKYLNIHWMDSHELWY